MKKLIKLIITLMLTVSAVSFISQISIPQQPAYASMGSTGGGGGGGGFGGDSDFSDYHSSSTNNNDDDSDWEPSNWFQKIIIDIIIVVVLISTFFSVVLPIITVAFGLIGGLIQNIGLHFRLARQYGVKHFRTDLLSENMTIDDFKQDLDDYDIVLKPVKDSDQYHEIAEVYTQAQFLYSQDLRERYVDHNYDLSNLLQYLDQNYYRVMTQEIRLKVEKGTIDETIVSKATITEAAQISDNIWIVKINAEGQDKEVQFNKDFEDSFTRSKWSDYVVYGKDIQGQVKILNLIYGEHFHLDGEDFNDQASLNGDSYEEKKI